MRLVRCSAETPAEFLRENNPGVYSAFLTPLSSFARQFHGNRLLQGLQNQGNIPGINELEEALEHVCRETLESTGGRSLVVVLLQFADLDSLFYFCKPASPLKMREPTGIEIFGNPRSNPTLKLSRWVTQRTALEGRKSASIGEVVLFDETNGNVHEGLISNIFVVIRDVVYTAPADSVLPGFCRHIVLEGFKRKGVSVVEEFPNVGLLNDWNEVFVCSNGCSFTSC